MALKLSILIATMPSRLEMLDELMANLNIQIDRLHDQVEVIIDPVVKYNIGTKRNKLLEKANGEYVVFIDDDDHVAYNYVNLILEACEEGSDCIGISGTMTTNGKKETQWHISKDFGSWYTKDNIHFRTPNHISPVKREIALKAGFPEIKFGEDFEYSMRLIPLIKTETKVNGNIYWYKYNSRK